jgi:hypothetical protein
LSFATIAGGVPAGAANAKYVGISVSAPPPASAERGHVGQQHEPLVRSHGERPQPAVLDEALHSGH